MIKQQINKLQRVCFLFAALLLSCLAAGFMTTKAAAAVSDGTHVFDFYSLDEDGLLTDTEEKALETLAEKYSKERGINFIIATTDYESGFYDYDPIVQDTIDYSELFYQTLLEEDPAYEDTVIFTINITNPSNSSFRYADVSGQGLGKEKMDSDRCSTLFEHLKPLLSDGDYYDACVKYLELAYKYVNIATFMDPDSLFLKLWFQLVLGFGISLIIILIMVHNSKGKMTVNGNSYLDEAHSRVLGRYDRYIRTTTTRTKISSSSGGGGGSHGGGGGGGGSHGGGHF